MKWVWLLLVSMSALSAEFSHTLESVLCPCQRAQLEMVWEEEKTPPFDELILSWNGFRPEAGKWTFWISLCQEGNWSPWLEFAEWTADSQKTFRSCPEGSSAESFQDAVYPKSGLCDGFRIKVVAKEGANLTKLESLFACLSSIKEHRVLTLEQKLSSVCLSDVPLQSQMTLPHIRAKDLCSPTSTSTAIRFLGGQPLDPALFAEKVRDRGFDIYGNWILNTAQGYCELGGAYRCHVERLNDFAALHSYLTQGLPVVVSVRGAIAGAPIVYKEGHLICVIGYNADTEEVRVIDSAFSENEKTSVSYPLKDFLEGWGRRKNIAYVFPKKL